MLTLEMCGDGRLTQYNNRGAADGREVLVLSLRLLTAADHER
jgi:hypothetical protein